MSHAILSLRQVIFSLFIACMALAFRTATAADLPTVRIGVLQFGTVSWELELMQRRGLAEREGVRLQIVPLAMKDGANVAIQGGTVDLIVNDWLWVARQRAEGRDFTFVPHSTAVGSILVPANSAARSLADLRGKRLGVAGGAADKSWLLLRAFAKKTVGADAAQFLQPDFVAPPLMNELAQRGEFGATFNYWHYSARLRAAGWRELVTMPQILEGLGIDRQLPMVGWVFREGWASMNPEAIRGFLRASAATKKLLAESDPAWDEIKALTKADDSATLRVLRDGYRAGIPPSGATAAKAGEAAAARAFAILAQEGGKTVVGAATRLAPGVFWTGLATQ